MVLSIRWTQNAADRFEAVTDYLETAHTGSGYRFLNDVTTALDRAAQHPKANPQIPNEPENTRKIVIPRFGYWIIYEIREDSIVVLTIWSARREPDSFKDGLAEP